MNGIAGYRTKIFGRNAYFRLNIANFLSRSDYITIGVVSRQRHAAQRALLPDATVVHVDATTDF